MWIGITLDNFLSLLQTSKCKDIQNEYGFSYEAFTFVFENGQRVKLKADQYFGYSQILVEKYSREMGDSIR